MIIVRVLRYVDNLTSNKTFFIPSSRLSSWVCQEIRPSNQSVLGLWYYFLFWTVIHQLGDQSRGSFYLWWSSLSSWNVRHNLLVSQLKLGMGPINHVRGILSILIWLNFDLQIRSHWSRNLDTYFGFHWRIACFVWVSSCRLYQGISCKWYIWHQPKFKGKYTYLGLP